IALLAVVLTIAIECGTILFRFGFGWKSQEVTVSTVGRLTGGIRIHHGYIGVLLAIAALGLGRYHEAAGGRLLVLGIALLCSDLIHHFLVLWPVTGNPEFYLVYPDIWKR
ncbi:unnamed protein product, partial [marine sediment metagenome]